MFGTSATLQPATAIAYVCTFVFKKMLSRVGVVCIVVPKDMLAVQKTQRESSPGPVLLPPCLQLIRLGSFLFFFFFFVLSHGRIRGVIRMEHSIAAYAIQPFVSGCIGVALFLSIYTAPHKKTRGEVCFFLLAEQNRLSVIV